MYGLVDNAKLRSEVRICQWNRWEIVCIVISNKEGRILVEKIRGFTLKLGKLSYSLIVYNPQAYTVVIKKDKIEV